MDTLDSLPDVLTPSEVSRLLRIGRNGVYDGIRRGEIPSLKIGRRLLVPKSALLQLLDVGGRPRTAA
jgi:excisionase family DNA binding protein